MQSIEKAILTISLTDTVVCALSLDDPAMQKELDVRFVRVVGERRWVFAGTLAGIRCVVDDMYTRGQSGHWDQPSRWMVACRRAFTTVKGQLEAQGVAVHLRGETVILEAR